MPKAIHQNHHRNCELAWWPTDTKENFDRLMQDSAYKEYAELVGWDQPGTITYKFNNDGFRGNNFNPLGNNLVALGCSFTMGIGLPEHQVWPWVVAKELDLEVCNLAAGGASADSCYRMAEYWIPKLRPKLVVMLTPPLGRLELIDKNDGTGRQIIPSDDDVQDWYVKTWLTIDQNSEINKRRNESAVWAVCQRAKIPCLIYNSSTYFAQAREVVGYARDYMHAGAIGHSILSTQILKDFNNLST